MGTEKGKGSFGKVESSYMWQEVQWFRNHESESSQQSPKDEVVVEV